MYRLALLMSLVALAFGLPIQAREKAELRFQGKKLKDWVTRLQTADTDEQRQRAARAICAFGPEAVLAVPMLVAMLDDLDEEFRRQVGDILCQLGPVAKSAVPTLVQSLVKKTARSPGVVIKVLGFIGAKAEDNPEVIPIVLTGLEDPELGLVSFWTLCTISPPAKVAIPALRRAIPKVRRNWNEHIVGIHFPIPGDHLPKLVGVLAGVGVDAIPLLAELLDDKEVTVQVAVAEVLGKFGPDAKKAVPALKISMRSEDEQVRLAAAFALLKIDKNPDAVIVVTSLLSENTEGGLFFSGPRGALMAESSRSMSAEATKILGELGPAAKSALPALRKLLSSKDESLQKAAREAIRKIEEPETKP